ncbi:MAG: RNA 2',3'-cyclic phosphodiesterase [Armatimonadia bacterium]
MAWDPEESWRLFFAVKVPEAIVAEVAALQERLQASGVKVKWVEPYNLHFTLKFLGATPAPMARDLKAVGERLARECEPFAVQLQGVGAFPKASHPQTVWVGVGQGQEQLGKLARKLHHALEDEALLLEANGKPFVPHCTIGRVKQERGLGLLSEALVREEEFASQSFWCEAFGLYRSDLKAEGPVYTEVGLFQARRNGNGDGTGNARQQE